MKTYDLAVIGSGPGGYVAAIKGAQLGMKVVCIEKDLVGGTCLNRGCIPSKTLLHASFHYHLLKKKSLSEFGIDVKDVSLNLDQMMTKKQSVVDGLRSGIESLFKKNKIDLIKGSASFLDGNHIVVNGKDSTTLKATNVIIATGSSVTDIPNLRLDGRVIISSDQSIGLSKVPKKMLIVGGGVIGLEMGSVWSRLGSDVTIIELGDSILSSMDSEIRNETIKILRKQGLQFMLNSKVNKFQELKDGTIEAEISDIKNDSLTNVGADILLLAIGRKPYTDGLALENAGIELNEKGRVKVNAKLQTSTPNIYAIGDVIEGPMLAHKAEEDGVAAVEIIAGQYGHVDYSLIPSVIYVHPEIACIGHTEDQLQKMGVDYKVGKFSMSSNSRARTMNETDGFVKVITDKATDKLLGAHIAAAQAGTMIAELSVAMAYGAAAEDIARVCHSHPDLNEAIKEACLAAYFKAINA